MKKLILLLATLIIFVTGCEQKVTPKPKPIQYKTVYKKIREKRQSTESSTHNRYNLLRGKFQYVTEVHTNYYFIYEDGTHETVSMEDYDFHIEGETITKKIAY